jgi:hypothetical protein
VAMLTEKGGEQREDILIVVDQQQMRHVTDAMIPLMPERNQSGPATADA